MKTLVIIMSLFSLLLSDIYSDDFKENVARVKDLNICLLKNGTTKKKVIRIAGKPGHIYYFRVREYEKRLNFVKKFYYNNGDITINFDEFNRVNEITGCI